MSLPAAFKKALDTTLVVGLITGAALPIITINVLLSTHRLFTNITNIRSWFLLTAGATQVVVAAAIINAAFHGRTKGLTYVGYICWELGIIALCAAGIIRFSIPFGVKNREKRIFIIVTSIIVSFLGVATLANGIYEISTWPFPPPAGVTPVYSMRHAALSLVLPSMYAFAGIVAFSFQLRRALNSSGTKVRRDAQDTRMQSLEVANYILCGFLLFTIILYFALFKMFKFDVPSYDTPTACLFLITFITCENAFETFTNALHDTTVSYNSSKGRSLPGSQQNSMRGEGTAAPIVSKHGQESRRPTVVASNTATSTV